MAKPILQQLDDYVTLGLEQAGDTIAPEIQLYKRFKPFVEDVLPTFISDQKPAYVAHPYAEQHALCDSTFMSLNCWPRRWIYSV